MGAWWGDEFRVGPPERRQHRRRVDAAAGAAVCVVLAVAWYVLAVRRVPGWPRRRTVSFLIGMALFAWTTNGVAQVYAHALFWMWTAQVLLLLLAVPVIVMAGQPVALARRVRGDTAWLVRASRSAVGRFFANPLVGPALVPLLECGLLLRPVAAVGRSPTTRSAGRCRCWSPSPER